jgi:hypothetical protein
MERKRAGEWLAKWSEARIQFGVRQPNRRQSVDFPRSRSEAEKPTSAAGQSHWLLPMSWPGETSRPNAVSGAICGASRPIAVTRTGEAARPLVSSKHFPPAAGAIGGRHGIKHDA